MAIRDISKCDRCNSKKDVSFIKNTFIGGGYYKKLCKHCSIIEFVISSFLLFLLVSILFSAVTYLIWSGLYIRDIILN